MATKVNITSETAAQLRDVLMAFGFTRENRWEDFPLTKALENGTITVFLQTYKPKRQGYKSVSVQYRMHTRFECFRECNLHQRNVFDIVKPTTDVSLVMGAELEAKAKKIDDLFIKFNEKLDAINESGCENL